LSSRGDDSQAIGDDFEATVFGDYIDKYLEKGILTGVYLKHEKFGNWDDIVFELNNNILHCIQTKASKTRDEITLGALFTIKTGKEFSLFQKLYSSYKILRKNFKEYQLKLELVTNKYPSSSTSGLPKERNKKISFSSFYREIWIPYKNNKITKEIILEDNINQQFLDRFSKHLGISNDELWNFLDHFNFNFGYMPTRARPIEEIKKIESFYTWFLITKKNPEKKGYFPLELLLKEFGLSVSPNPHDFPVEKEKYISFPSLKDNLIKEVLKRSKGYLFLQGGPSTGKSTFLESEINTKTFRNCYIFKYLCFRDPNELSHRSRGEIDHFYEDLNEQFRYYIRSTSFKDVNERFIENLYKLSEMAEEKEKKVLIIIDGIDHVTQEEMEKLAKPLTSYLPKPSTLPNRIIFLVSGQHFDSIPWYKQSEDFKELNIFHIPTFTEKEIELYLMKYFKNETPLEFEIIEVLLNKTQGNPRYLKHICENFESYDDLRNNKHMINENLDFNGWDNIYEKYWVSFGFEDDSNYNKIAGLISRIHGPIDLMWLQSWLENTQVDIFILKFKFFFKQYSNIILFDHNSFKQFLQKKSVKFGGISIKDKEKEIYNDLASRCNENNIDSYAHWNKIIYLKKAERIKDFDINVNYFLSHWLQGRNLADIIEDIGNLLEYYMENNEIETTFKIILLKLEFELRQAINELDTNPNYIFLINLVFKNSEYHILYLCANILNSVEVSPLFKLDYILYMMDQGFLKEENNIFLLINDYFKDNRHNWIEVSHNPDYDKKFTKKWLQVALIFEKDSNKIITDYKKFLLGKHKSYLLEGERWRYYPILLMMGEFLIENSMLESLEIIYEILNELIERDKWELKDTEKLTFKNKYRDELRHSIKLENPVIIILKLKYEESKIRGKEYFENFLNKNNTYKIIFNNSTLSEIFRIYFSNNLSEDDIIKLMGVGFTLEYSYSGHYKGIKNRAFLYRNLYDKFGYDKEKVWVLCKGMHRVHENLTRKAKKMQWEYAFFDLAIQLDKEYKDLIQARPLSDSITILFEFYANHSNFIDESGRRIFFDFSGFLSFLIEEIKPYTFLYKWFQISIFEYFKQSNYMFNDIRSQIRIIGRIYKCFKEINHDLVKWVIKNAKENYSIQEIGYWNLSSTIYEILEVLEILKNDHTSFYEENRNYFIDKLKIFGFRLYPRKDYQLENLIYMVKNMIHYFPKEDSNFNKIFHRVCDMLNIAEEIAEHAGIFDVKKRFYEILLTWDQNLAKSVYYTLGINRYIPREIISHKLREELKVPKTFFTEISKLLKTPPKFIEKINSFFEEIDQKELSEQREYSVDMPKILAELDELDNVTFANWEELFEYFINQGKDKSVTEISNTDFIFSFFEFFINKKQKMGFEKLIIKDLEIKIKKALLKSPKDEFPFVSIEKLYTLDKSESFDYGWEVLYNQFVIRRKKILHYIPHDFIMYTFLSKINKTNFENFWDVYFTYLKRLFRLMDFF